MSLIDTVLTAKGGASVIYGQKGRHVVQLERVLLREANPKEMVKANFSVDVRVLHCDRPDFAEGAEVNEKSYKKNTMVRFNDPLMFDSGYARARRTLRIAKQSKNPRELITEAEFGLARKDGEGVEEFNARLTAELNRLVGPEQPLQGAIFVITATEGRNKKTGGVYTLFEPEMVTQADLIAAGLVQG